MAIQTEEKQKPQGSAAPTSSEDGNAEGNGAENSNGSAAPKKRSLVIPIVAGIVAIIGIIFGVRYWIWSQSHVSTDDAQIASDLVQIAPQVTGTVSNVYVSDNQVVKAGQLLVELDPRSYQATYDQALANLDVARATARGAGINVGLTRANTAATVTQAQAGISQADAGVRSSIADLQKAGAAVSTARAQASSAHANVASALASLRSAIANQQHAVDALHAAQAQSATAAAAVRSSQAQVTANRSSAARTARDAARYSALYNQGAISASVADQALSAAEVAAAQLQSSEDAVAQAEANLRSAQANVSGAQSQVDAARDAVSQARAAVVAAQGTAAAADDSVRQAIASEASSKAGVATSQGKVQQAIGVLQAAQTAPRQIHVQQANYGQAGARIETSEAQLESARIDLARTKIYAPVSGKISKKTVTIGNLVSPGTPLMSLVPTEQPWVIANFKETQLTNVRVGQPVDVEVDAFPGKVFHGRVNSISAGTGATFALLPPDNATGNFTKIVQRVPVKITFDPGQEGLDRLTVGMSVTATIDTKPE